MGFVKMEVEVGDGRAGAANRSRVGRVGILGRREIEIKLRSLLSPWSLVPLIPSPF